VSGTSFSNAFISAEAALLIAQSVKDIAGTIAGSAVNIDSLNPSYAGQLGYGRIDLLAAVVYIPQTVTTQTPSSRAVTGYIVRLQPGTGKSQRESNAKGAGANVKFNFDIVEAISIDADNISAGKLAHNPNVIEVVQDLPVFALGAAGGGGGTSSQVTPTG